MPHISKRALPDSTKKELRKYLDLFVFEFSSKRREKLFHELFTPTERTMVAKRLLLLSLLTREVPAHAAGELLGMSPSTVARFQHRLRRGAYNTTTQWLQKIDEDTLSKLVRNLAAIAFPSPRQSLAKFFLDEL